MPAASIPANAVLAGPRRSPRRLALASDERLVEQIRHGDDAAFEVVFERHSPGILSFCRHMLGSPDEAEDAVQHTFASAFRHLRADERDVALKPWLFAIARNRCVSILRGRREQPAEELVVATAGLAEQVEERAELRQLLDDVRELPDEQRAALLLAEVGDLSHGDIAAVLDCEVPRVKALVYRARSGLIARRVARETPCADIRQQLANLRGGSLRRSELRLHLHECPGCRAYRDEVKRQRELLAAALPVAPTVGLKASVLAAVGIGGGSAAGGAAAGVAASTAAFSGAGLAKLAAVAVLAGAGVAGGQAVVGSSPAVLPISGGGGEGSVHDGKVGGGTPAEGVDLIGSGRSGAVDRDHAKPRHTPSSGRVPGPGGRVDGEPGLRDQGHGRRVKQALRGGDGARVRGPVDAPRARTQGRRGSPQPKRTTPRKLSQPVPAPLDRAPFGRAGSATGILGTTRGAGAQEAELEDTARQRSRQTGSP